MQCKTAHDQAVTAIRNQARADLFKRQRFGILARAFKISASCIRIHASDIRTACLPQCKCGFATATGQVQYVVQVWLPTDEALMQRFTDCRFVRVAIAAASTLIKSLHTETHILPSDRFRLLGAVLCHAAWIYGSRRCMSRGNRVASRMLSRHSNCIMSRSRPIAKPPCGGIPYLKVSKYCSNGSNGYLKRSAAAR